MYNYSGIKPEIVELLSINRFNDSKAFYEEHKEKLKQGATVPMRQIVLDLSDLMYDLDPLADLNPIYSVSRIRRDTRRTKSKLLYRENLWLMLRRNKKIYPFAPFYWFEFLPAGYCFGLGYWVLRQSQFDPLREKIIEEPDRWLKAIKCTEDAGLIFNSRDYYKKDKCPDSPENLKKYINAKNMEFSRWNSNLNNIASENLIDELRRMLQISSPMYQFLIEAYDKAVSEGLINANDYQG